MKLKLKLKSIAELPGGIVSLAFEAPEGPHTIVFAKPEACAEFSEEDIGCEFDMSVLKTQAPPASALPPSASPNENSGTLPPETASGANAGVLGEVETFLVTHREGKLPSFTKMDELLPKVASTAASSEGAD